MSSEMPDGVGLLTEDGLTKIIFGHSAFQYLNAGIDLGVLERLHVVPNCSLQSLMETLELPDTCAYCLMLGLTALGIVIKDEQGYRNAHLIEKWFCEGKWELLVDVVHFQSRITYVGQSDFVESLKLGNNVGLRAIPGMGDNLYHRLAESKDLKQTFYRYMSSWSKQALPRLLEAVDFSTYERVTDMGGGDGTVALEIARRNPSVHITIIDLSANTDVALENLKAARLEERVTVLPADMFEDDLPIEQDCFLFVHQLVIWPKEKVLFLMKRAYERLRDGGELIIYNSMSSDEGNGPLMAALDSVYFICIPEPGGMIHSWGFYEECLRESGFVNLRRKTSNGWTPHGAIIATKQ